MRKTESFAGGLYFLFLLVFSECLAAGGTAGLWSFDDGVPTNTASSLASETNAPVLNASVAFYGAGKAPRFDADVPGASVWGSLTGSPINGDNPASLRFVNAGLPVNTNSNDGGYATVADTPLLRATNLTVEAFVKVNRRVNWPLLVGKRRTENNGTSWNLDMDNAGKPRVRIDSQPIGASSGSGWNQSWTATVSIEDGRWHHLAFTYTHTNRAVRLYVDYVLRASGNSYSNIVYDSCELRIGQGAGGRAFDGWIDEVRVSDRVLIPEQFTTLCEPTDTVGYWAFDDGATGATAGTLTNTFYMPFMHGSAVAAGGAKPTFSNEIPPNTTRRVSDGTNGPVINVRNSASLHFVNAGLPSTTNSVSGGQVTVAGAAIPSQTTNFTAEAFVRVDRHVNFPQIIGRTRLSTSGVSWSLALNSAGNLRARFDTQVPPGTSGFNQYFESAAKVEDGKWHHVALTYDWPTKTVRLYADCAKVVENVLTGQLVLDNGDIRIGNGDQAFDGWIDEVRLTARVLTPAEFLHTAPVVGSVSGIQ